MGKKKDCALLVGIRGTAIKLRVKNYSESEALAPNLGRG